MASHYNCKRRGRWKWIFGTFPLCFAFKWMFSKSRSLECNFRWPYKSNRIGWMNFCKLNSSQSNEIVDWFFLMRLTFNWNILLTLSQHVKIEVPYHVHTVHHHHIEKYPVYKKIEVPVIKEVRVPFPVHVPVKVPYPVVVKPHVVTVPVHHYPVHTQEHQHGGSSGGLSGGYGGSSGGYGGSSSGGYGSSGSGHGGW